MLPAPLLGCSHQHIQLVIALIEQEKPRQPVGSPTASPALLCRAHKYQSIKISVTNCSLVKWLFGYFETTVPYNHVYINPAELLLRLWRALHTPRHTESPSAALPGTEKGASAFSPMDIFQRTTDLDLFTASAFVFHHCISTQQDFLSHCDGNLGLTLMMMLGLSRSLAAISIKTNWTRRSHGATVALCQLAACFPTACQQVALPHTVP